MKSSKLKKLCAVVLAATLATSLFIGCGDSSSNSGSSSSNQQLVFNLGEDPETMDPTLNNKGTPKPINGKAQILQVLEL